jgi:hypothetical protein
MFLLQIVASREKTSKVGVESRPKFAFLAEFTIFASEAVLAFLLPPGQPLPPAG